MREWEVSGRKIRLIQGNIALMEADAIVNAANKSLILGGGVAGAIRRFGGPTIQEECDRIGPIATGDAVLTGAGNLKARHVIHAAGPVYGEGDEDEKLASATFNSLRLARENKLKTIVFPAISTGIFGFPIRRCGEIMLRAAQEFLESSEHPSEVVFCLYDRDTLEVFAQCLESLKTSVGPP